MNTVLKYITLVFQDYLGLTPNTIKNILITITIVICYILIRFFITRALTRYVSDRNKRYVLAKSSTYLIALVTLLLVVKIWISKDINLLTYIGLLSAGVAIALQEPLMNLAGWLFIVVRKPFEVGDRLEINKTAGDVIDIRLFQFSILEIGNWVHADQSTGRIIHIPNGWVFKHSLANFTVGFNFIWNEIEVTITFESNWAKAKDILLKIAQENSGIDNQKAMREIRELSRNYLIHFKHLTPYVWTKGNPNGIALTIRYLSEPRQRRGTQTKIWEAILKQVAQNNDIDFAYPTQRIFFNPDEGKPGAGGPNN